MSVADSPLQRHLATAVVVKLALLAVLWFVFVRDAHVAVDTEQTAAHVSGVPPGPGAKP
ncbi:cytochrome oxidase putative small subunit CydP [Aquabacterium sp. CECT 9606]|uniref:cytochrome oxidase putative small subunit CydP n=1 Tax=Aquabacterium sp. CECT 9606 TaxID=2845822 RepID=UPI001E2DF2B6|nr:cytochrome oxidase putative small subunit CydP [Aquabacterium sp. CECT 9606]